MNLARFPRRRYTPTATQIAPLPRLTAELGGARVWVKRDDTLGLVGGGNKTRKLEFLVADALANGADTLITCGAPQSNHCRLTLGAAVVEGLACRLVLEEHVPSSYDPQASGNNFLYRLLGAEQITVVPGGTDLDSAMDDIVGSLGAEGRTAYAIPVGGSNALGALGYVSCAQEILAQSFELGVSFDAVVACSGSAGTHAGLIVGMHGNNAQIPVHGVSNGRHVPEQHPKVRALCDATTELLGIDRVPNDAIVIQDGHIGGGYSVPTPEMAEAVQLLARLEGILLDPVYTGKAMAGLIHSVRTGLYGSDDDVLFVHTGGGPSLYAFESDVLR